MDASSDGVYRRLLTKELAAYCDGNRYLWGLSLKSMMTDLEKCNAVLFEKLDKAFGFVNGTEAQKRALGNIWRGFQTRRLAIDGPPPPRRDVVKELIAFCEEAQNSCLMKCTRTKMLKRLEIMNNSLFVELENIYKCRFGDAKEKRKFDRIWQKIRNDWHSWELPGDATESNKATRDQSTLDLANVLVHLNKEGPPGKAPKPIVIL